jgi:sugar phosphate isomerase/epimerase
MKLGCSSWSFHRAFNERRITRESFIKKCADEFALDGIELLDSHFPSAKNADIKKIKKLCIDNGLIISCVSVSNNFGAPRKEERQREVEKVKKWTEIAYKYGASVLRVFAGWLGRAPWEPSSQSQVEIYREKLWPEMIKCMKECSKYAENIGVVLGIENHNHGGFIRKASDVFRIIREVNSDWLRLNLDTGGYIDNYKSIESTIQLAVHIHAKLYDLDENGADRILDYNRIFDLLNKSRYKGFLSIEYEGKEDELLSVSRAINFLKRHIF